MHTQELLDVAGVLIGAACSRSVWAITSSRRSSGYDGAVGLTAGRFGAWLSRRRRARKALDVGSGTIMVALAGRLALER